MNLIEVIFLAGALGVDCLVVSFSQGLIFTSSRIKNSIALALTMGFFQALMPCIGYTATGIVSTYIEPFSKWIVFIIFTALAIKFIYEAFQKKEETICCIGLKCLLSMGIATSIDALCAGVNIHLTRTPLLYSALLIGLGSVLMSLSGFWLGTFFKKLPSKFLEITGGLILFILGLKSLL